MMCDVFVYRACFSILTSAYLLQRCFGSGYVQFAHSLNLLISTPRSSCSVRPCH